ncbi:MAG: arginine--tRNA ligase, partial [Myxococcales bacterium]|nr:arginine--tRNA ligase [Myxococcales bacterium]
THARTCGIAREAASRGVVVPAPEEIDASPLVLPEELGLVRELSNFPEVVADAARSREPHHVAYYLRDLAGLWNPYLQDGKRHRILGDDPALSMARLALAEGVRTVMANGLALLGMRAPERM